MSPRERPARRQLDPGRRPTSPPPPAAAAAAPPPSYQPAAPGLATCQRCGSVVVDLEPARTAHGAFHAHLAQLWAAVNGRTA